MALSKTKKKDSKLAEQIYKQTHFTKVEVENLLGMFRELLDSSQKVKLDRSIFRTVLHKNFQMTDDILLDRIFRAFDKDNDSNICMDEFINGMSIFLRGTAEEQMMYCFGVYDLNSDGYITREEMFHMLKQSLIVQPSEEDPDEGVKDLVEIALKKMDYDRDSQLSYTDYKQAVEAEPLLLEAFGPCLPDHELVEKFNLEFAEPSPS